VKCYLEETDCYAFKSSLDAIVSAWIAQEFLFEAHKSEVVFVTRKVPGELVLHADCIVDVGNR